MGGIVFVITLLHQQLDDDSQDRPGDSKEDADQSADEAQTGRDADDDEKKDQKISPGFARSLCCLLLQVFLPQFWGRSHEVVAILATGRRPAGIFRRAAAIGATESLGHGSLFLM